MQPAVKKIPPTFIFMETKKVLNHIIKEKAIHMMPLALLYATVSAISDSFTVLPDQNHIGFSRLHAYIPIPVNNRLIGTIIINQMTLSIIFVLHTTYNLRVSKEPCVDEKY